MIPRRSPLVASLGPKRKSLVLHLPPGSMFCCFNPTKAGAFYSRSAFGYSGCFYSNNKVLHIRRGVSILQNKSLLKMAKRKKMQCYSFLVGRNVPSPYLLLEEATKNHRVTLPQQLSNELMHHSVSVTAWPLWAKRG